MSRTGQFLMFCMVAVAVGAITGLTGPGSIPSLAAAGGGLLLLHLFALYGIWRLQRRIRELEGNRASGTSAREPIKPYAATPSVDRKRRDRPESPLPRIPEADEVVVLKETDPAAVPDEVANEELALWLEHENGQGFVESEEEEISFLPPFASDAVADDPEVTAPGEAPSEWGAPDAAEAEPAASNARQETVRNVPIPRHFALGTVAIIRRLMEPEEVAQVMLEQRHQPKLRFGEVAVQLGFLTPGQVDELLLAQKEGLFTDDEIREARARLRAFHESRAESDRG